MKFRDINRKRLWILLTVLWCIGVVVYFSQPIAKEYHNNSRAQLNEYSKAHNELFVKCLTDNGSNVSDFVRENSDRCIGVPRMSRVYTNASWAFLNGDSYYRDCLRYTSRECGHIYSFHPNEPTDKSPLFINSSKSKYYKAFLAKVARWEDQSYKQLQNALLFFFGIPLLFAVFPRIVSLLSFLKRWLVSK